jgi:hypothetical protein
VFGLLGTTSQSSFREALTDRTPDGGEASTVISGSVVSETPELLSIAPESNTIPSDKRWRICSWVASLDGQRRPPSSPREDGLRPHTSERPSPLQQFNAIAEGEPELLRALHLKIESAIDTKDYAEKIIYKKRKEKKKKKSKN